ncbi:argininosuccinate synthase [Candidatus Gottesmanbacteria bacterium RBG_16_37_8]|uniref:Argininosuccinate synthase n=1 Tax=Candidatus Gottesmanbacteria bacterium RBG_16_37_8 TaxID=1798371 RepID=A0A1F5YUB5_9BACT|nr:MAG: argininosuccinate synthase [Candidatus Gottesmanbacteria bacterium RBG_16_37_8]
MKNLPKKHKDYQENKKQGKTCLLMYSGGVDTSICVVLLQKYYGYKVITATVDLGQKFQNPKEMGEKAIKLGAIKHLTIEASEEFVKNWVLSAILANAYYDEKYCLSTSLARPLTAKKCVEAAKKLKVDSIAHGCKGRGADAFRINMVFKFLAPDLPVVLPIHDWNPTRQEEAEFAHKEEIPIPVDYKNPFSYDENLWGVAINYGTIDEIEKSVPEEAFKWTVRPQEAPEKGEKVIIEFYQGRPISINGKEKELTAIIENLNKIGGVHGIGRKDMIENGLYGNKFRWVYESPAADILLSAHKELEKAVLPKQTLYFKEQVIDKKWAELAYYSYWYSPLMAGLTGFIKQMQKYVTGSITLFLYKGSIAIIKRSSPCSIVKSIYPEIKDFVPFGYEEYLFSSTHPGNVKNILNEKGNL